MFFVLALLRLRAERGRNRNLQAIAIFLALAVPLAAQTPDDLLNRAIESADAGNYDAAVHDALAAARLYASAHDPVNQAVSLNQAGLAQMYAGHYPEARATFLEALRIATAARDYEGVVEERTNLASVDFYTGRYADAADHYSAIERVLDTHRTEAWARRHRHILLANRATLDQRLGRYDEALAAYQRALADTADLLPEEHAQMLANVGVLYRRMGDPYKALDAYDRARALFARDQHSDGELGVLKNRGIVLALDLKRLEEGRATFAEAYARATSAGNAREALQAQLYGAETELRLGRTADAARHFRAAQDAAVQLETVEDQWKALYGLARCALAAGDDAEATAQLRKAIEVIERIREAIRVPSLKSDFFNDKREVFDALIALRLRHGATAAEIFDLIERGHSRGWREHLQLPARVELRAVQNALDKDTVLLDYWMSAVVIVTKTSAEVRPIRVDANEIRALSNALARADGDWSPHAQKIATQLLPPIPKTKPHVMIVSDGPLASIPFEVLGDLVEHHDVTYIPTAALLLRPPHKTHQWSPPWTRQLRAFADPVFGSAPLERSPTRLAASADEVRAIAKELGGKSLLHLGPDNQKQHLLEPITPLLHIASHAFVDPGAMEQSRILFSAERANGPATYLFLKEAYELPLKGVELAVLSACDTERGRVLPGEGIESFSRAFLAAGARSTVTTLWRVPDATTASFMRVFYHHLQRGASRAEALRRAKLRFRGSGAHPHYWAAFVLTGEGQQPVPTAVRWRTIVLAGAALLAALALLVFLRRS